MKEDEFLTNETYLGQPVYGKYIDIKKIAIQSYIPLNIPDSFFLDRYWKFVRLSNKSEF